MKERFRYAFSLIVLLVVVITFSSCGDKEDPIADLTGSSLDFSLVEFDNSGITGSVRFEERSDGSFKVTIDITGTLTQDLPAQLRNGDEIEGGEILVSLNPVSSATGISETEVSQTIGGVAITYSSLATVNGHVRVNSDPLDLATVAAAVGIGNNELLSNSESYSISEVSGSGVSGTLTFTERKGGHTLASMDFDGTISGTLHPAGIYENNAEAGGTEIVTLNEINGDTGLSFSSIRTDKNGTTVTYSDLTVLDGHCIVQLSPTSPSIVARSDIAGNSLTGTEVTYKLDSIADPNIKGTATLQEKRSGEARLVIELESTPTGGVHPAAIYEGIALDGGNTKYLTLNSVDGDDGTSITHIEADDAGTDVTYADLAEYPGYIKIELSPSDATVVAEGDFGSNGLTGRNIGYLVVSQGGSGITGLAIFEERYNGQTLITLDLEGTTPGNNHQAHIHENSLSTSGGIELTFPNDVDGSTGISMNNVTKWDNNKGPNNDGAAVTYSELLEYDGHVLIHQGPTGGTPVAGADIGSNAN